MPGGFFKTKARFRFIIGLLIFSFVVFLFFNSHRIVKRFAFRPLEVNEVKQNVKFHRQENQASEVQLPYGTASDEMLGLPEDLRQKSVQPMLNREIPGRRIPELAFPSQWNLPELTNHLVPLPEANTLAHINYQERRFGRLQKPNGETELFNPEVVLVKFAGMTHVGALRVEPMREREAVQTLQARNDVEFAELDTFQKREFVANDLLIASQWHHQIIGSPQAWNFGLGSASVRIAIVDTPFQMNHPDLAANTVNGFDVVANVPVTTGTGIAHSTLCAGMAAAVINNKVGVAGAVNCSVLPININGAISEMYNATIWAADNGVRVVSISWTGGTDPSLEVAGNYLKTNTAGVLVMSAYDGNGIVTGPNQPDIYCISMTDAADNIESTMSGAYIDFAAPGWQIYSTTISSGYATGSGTSYAAPLFAGVVAGLFSINPLLNTDDVIGILRQTASPLGSTLFYGAGRVNFGTAAVAAAASLPNIVSLQNTNGAVTVSANFHAGWYYSLWRTSQLSPAAWSRANFISVTNANMISLTDTNPPASASFYRIQATLQSH